MAIGPKSGNLNELVPGTFPEMGVKRVVATMSKARDEDVSDDEKGSTLKVSQAVAQLVGKIAAHRRKSVAKLFKDKDVEDFFSHLLLEEMRLETERLKKRKP